MHSKKNSQKQQIIQLNKHRAEHQNNHKFI